MRRHILAFSCLSLAIAGCGPKSPQSSIDLLRGGDPRACIAGDVEKAMRTLLEPNRKTTSDYALSFSNTSLDAFDAAVSRATCNTLVNIEGPNGTIAKGVPLDFSISPASQDPSTFIISANAQMIRQQWLTQIEIDDEQKEEEAARRQKGDALAALVKPGWLIGRWFDESDGSQACSSNPFHDFARGGRYVDAGQKGRWELAGQTITVILPTKTKTIAILDAEQNQFAAEDANGDTVRFLRCSRAESAAVEQPAAGGELTEDLAEAERTEAQ